jgi:hypothetical protein
MPPTDVALASANQERAARIDAALALSEDDLRAMEAQVEPKLALEPGRSHKTSRTHGAGASSRAKHEIASSSRSSSLLRRLPAADTACLAYSHALRDVDQADAP